MKSEAPVCGGDAPKAEDKLKKLSLSVPKRDKNGGDYTEHSDISEIDLNLYVWLYFDCNRSIIFGLMACRQ